MQKGNSDEIVEFFREVQRVISKHGLEKVMRQLRTLQIDLSEGYEKDVCEYIMVVTANHYTIEKDELIHSNKRGTIAEARRMCFALMKEHLPLSDEKIGDYFGGKSRQFVNRELRDLPLNQDEFATKDEAKFVNDFLDLTTQVLYYKNSYELNKNDASA